MTKPHNVAIIGASGSIGHALMTKCATRYPDATIHAFSRKPSQIDTSNIRHHSIDLTDETSIENAANIAADSGSIDMTIVATGLLHDQQIMPEKSLRDMTTEKFEQLFATNTIGPALVAKHFLSNIPKDNRSIFAALSARVGSISDNHLGGWYAYRASKAALNMVIKNASIEIERRYKQAIIVGLHPGTVNSNLSKPFQGNVAEGKLFTPEYSANALLQVIEGLTPTDSGKCFAWDGQEILP